MRESSRRAERARVAALAAALLAAAASAATAQGVSFGAPMRVPRAHDSAIGMASAGDPALDFMLHCQGCHRADGSGLDGAVPDFRGNLARLAAAPGGREYLSRVPGVAQSGLDDAATAALLDWLIRRFDGEHVPDGFAPFTAEEIGPWRREPLVSPSEVRRRLVTAIGEPGSGY